MSSWLYVGIVLLYVLVMLGIGYAGKLGWGFGIHTMWIVLGNTVIGSLLAWMILAGRTRDMTVRLNAITMPEFLRARYGWFTRSSWTRAG